MKKFTKHIGKAVAIYQPNIDTDQILPKQFLKRIERTGFGEFLFYDWRFNPDGSVNRDFVLNDPRYKDASILLAGVNFGCGSSREHAPWALEDYGFRAVIAPSFADIFYNNCFKTGILPVVLDEKIIAGLVEKSQNYRDFELTVDLENRIVSDNEGWQVAFDVDDFRRYCLLNGLDDIGLTLRHEAKIREYEKSRPMWLNLKPK
jgi:3-isopropylmalate/(R)-2-methylmalate dehydratase small subunit